MNAFLVVDVVITKSQSSKLNKDCKWPKR